MFVCFRAAVEHLLIALKLQRDSRNPKQTDASSDMSDCIWNSLRMALILMGRGDMNQACDMYDLDTILKEFPQQS